MAGDVDASSGCETGDDVEDDTGDDAGSGGGLDAGGEPPTVMFLKVSSLTVKLYSE